MTCAEAGRVNYIMHGGVCTPRCDLGYTPSREELNCTAGSLSPPTFECYPPCVMPYGIEDAAPEPCVEPVLTRGSVCTTRCADGFTPSVPELLCTTEQELTIPANFSCEPDCALPDQDSIQFAADEFCAGKSNSTTHISHGDVCNVQCQRGYIPSAVALHCSSGALSPPNVSCLPKPILCDVPSGIENSAEEPCVEVPQTEHIRHRGACTTQCLPDYMPSARYLNCSLGTLAPASFACIPCAQVNFLLADNPVLQPGLGGGLISAPEDMWCYYTCGRVRVKSADNDGLDLIAKGLFRHLPCAEFSGWLEGEVLAGTDLLVATASSFDRLPDTVLADNGFRGIVVLVDFGCGDLSVVAHPALRCWVDRVMYVGADRLAATAYATFLEVPPGALKLMGRHDRNLQTQLSRLRISERQTRLTKTKFLAYRADECIPEEEKLFDLIYERLRGFGAVEALGRCHGSHPEAAVSPCNGACATGDESFRPFRFVLAVEPSAASQRRCPRSVNITVLDALIADAVPLYRGPDEAGAVLNDRAVISVPPWDLVESGLGLLRAAAAAEGGSVLPSEDSLAQAAPLQNDARTDWFAWDKALRSEQTSLAAKAIALLTPIMKGSPAWRCWAYQASKRLY